LRRAFHADGKRRLGGLAELLAQGALAVTIGGRFPLEDADTALAQVRHGAHGIAIVLRPTVRD
jgi:NADPH:quinone reductase-like Zn-dependent oxidoreductase